MTVGLIQLRYDLKIWIWYTLRFPYGSVMFLIWFLGYDLILIRCGKIPRLFHGSPRVGFKKGNRNSPETGFWHGDLFGNHVDMVLTFILCWYDFEAILMYFWYDSHMCLIWVSSDFHTFHPYQNRDRNHIKSYQNHSYKTSSQQRMVATNHICTISKSLKQKSCFEEPSSYRLQMS